jgi:hypothetical protein
MHHSNPVTPELSPERKEKRKDAQQEIIEAYIRRNRFFFSREMISNRLQKWGYDPSAIESAWVAISTPKYGRGQITSQIRQGAIFILIWFMCTAAISGLLVVGGAYYFLPAYLLSQLGVLVISLFVFFGYRRIRPSLYLYCWLFIRAFDLPVPR